MIETELYHEEDDVLNQVLDFGVSDKNWGEDGKDEGILCSVVIIE